MLIEILGSSGAGKTTANGTSCSKFKIVLVELSSKSQAFAYGD
jgi:adenylate kinase family enzyme